MLNPIDRSSEVNKVANSLSDNDFFGGSGKKHSKEIEALQTGIKEFGAGIGSFIPGFGAIAGIASAILGGLAAVFGS